MGGSGSTVVRRQLGRRLRALREATGKTREDVVTARICSRAKLEKIESGKVSIRPGDTRELGLFFGADHRTIESLVVMAHATSEPGWWEEYGDAMRADFALYVGLEATASHLFAYESEVVHGLLQTAAYARAVERGTSLDITEAMVDRHVRLRMERQRAVFCRPRPLRAEIILSEATLLKPMGPAPVMREALAHLRGMARRETVTVRVLPLAAGPTPTAYGRFAVLDFDDPADPPVVYLETYRGAHYPEEPVQVEQFRRRFAVVREKSVPIQEYRP